LHGWSVAIPERTIDVPGRAIRDRGSHLCGTDGIVTVPEPAINCLDPVRSRISGGSDALVGR
jgi:hypothetical protein